MEGSDVCAVDLTELTIERVIAGMVSSYTRSEEAYLISPSGSTIAWHGESDSELSIMDLNSAATREFTADNGERIHLLGFMGEDLVIGLSRAEDALPDQTGSVVEAMYRILIVDNSCNILGSYESEGYYVTSARVDGEQIRLTRVTRREGDEVYRAAGEDQITNTLRGQEKESRVITVVTRDMGTTVEIRVSSAADSAAPILRTPNMTLYEGSRQRSMNGDPVKDERLLYVYDMRGRAMVYANVAEAVRAAYTAPGVACDADGGYIWIRGNLRTSNQLMALTHTAEAIPDMTEYDSTALCLTLMLQQAGVTADVDSLMAAGHDPEQILWETLSDRRVLALDACPMDAVLYYVDMELPVLTQRTDGTSMLIIGFNDVSVGVIDPARGFIGKLGRGEMAAIAAESGDRYLTYR